MNFTSSDHQHHPMESSPRSVVIRSPSIKITKCNGDQTADAIHAAEVAAYKEHVMYERIRNHRSLSPNLASIDTFTRLVPPEVIASLSCRRDQVGWSDHHQQLQREDNYPSSFVVNEEESSSSEMEGIFEMDL